MKNKEFYTIRENSTKVVCMDEREAMILIIYAVSGDESVF